ncbi:hypothetical protein [Caldilinea sp.]|uniref:hypothetical protein n=1 Tax=Caldilinea sp. TaxID=2293560 RepID=UPI002C4655A3|nr:hypothetical protein [Caldilinea sp.]HRA68518.1 hypothetical protein [Caldilinea sp.]
MADRVAGAVRGMVEAVAGEMGWAVNGHTTMGRGMSSLGEMGSGFDEAHEPAVHLIVCSQDERLLRRFLAALRGQPLLAPASAAIRHEGLFTLVWLRPPPGWMAAAAPAVAPGCDLGCDNGAGWCEDPPWNDSSTWNDPPAEDWSECDPDAHLRPFWQEAACALYLAPAAGGWDAADAQAFARLRSLGPPLLPVVTCGTATELAATTTTALVQRLSRALGVAPLTVMTPAQSDDAEDAPAGVSDSYATLLRRLLAYAPALAGALGCEAPHLRRQVAADRIRTTVWLAACVGLEPLPIVDLPVQLLLQRRMAHTIAAIYGQPPPGLVSGEGVGLLTAGLTVRYVTQQLVRLAPGIGWLLSGALSGVSTWLLGRTLVLHYSQRAPSGVVVEQMLAACRRRLRSMKPSKILRSFWKKSAAAPDRTAEALSSHPDRDGAPGGER